MTPEQERIAQLELDVSFVARLIFLREAGHATPGEIQRLRDIAGRTPRWQQPNVDTDSRNATP